MNDRPITLVLQDQSHIEKSVSKDLRHKALDLVKSAEDESLTTQLQLPDALLDLITQIIKPLFSKDSHSKLTSAGRKVLVNDALPASVNRFSSQILFDEDSKPLWKNGWTSSLLLYILRSYDKITDESVRRKTIEGHFHLLVPAILHQVDDIDIAYKCYGCQCLKLLCDTIYGIRGEILKRSGLTDVFIDALKNDFSLLPTLTPEDESLSLYEVLYPAYRSLVRARFPYVDDGRGDYNELTGSKTTSTAASTGQKVKHRSTDANAEAEYTLRQSYLTLLLRHQLLHSLHHLSTGTGLGSSMSLDLSTFLIGELSWIFEDMGIHSVTHLQTVLPLLRNVLIDPFATAAPDMLLAALESLQAIVCVTWPRIRERWWGEILRGVVGCWVNVVDDEADGNPSSNLNRKNAERAEKLKSVKRKLRVLACLLEDVVGKDFVAAKQELITEDLVLEGLFEGFVGGETERNTGTEMKAQAQTQMETTAAMKKGMIQEL